MSTICILEIQKDPKTFILRIEVCEIMLAVWDDRPVSEVRPFAASAHQPRTIGLCAGQFSVPADFDKPLPDEILQDFEE